MQIEGTKLRTKPTKITVIPPQLTWTEQKIPRIHKETAWYDPSKFYFYFENQ